MIWVCRFGKFCVGSRVGMFPRIGVSWICFSRGGGVHPEPPTNWRGQWLLWGRWPV